MWQGGEGLGRECVTYSLVHLRILHSSADLDLCGRGDMLCVCVCVCVCVRVRVCVENWV